jgi:hypothetical protein
MAAYAELAGVSLTGAEGAVGGAQIAVGGARIGDSPIPRRFWDLY